MNLIGLFDTLTVPTGNDKTYNALQIPGYSNFRLAIDYEGNPIILLSIIDKTRIFTLKNFRLKYLQLEQNIDCKIIENKSVINQTFTVIKFTSIERHLCEYFLRISETLIYTLGNEPSQKQIIESLNRFVEVFRTLSDTPSNTVHGLWSELFLIDNSKSPASLLTYWHTVPEEKFDFNSGKERIEVKSNSNFERFHFFSSEQLNPPLGTNLLIASIFIRQNNTGRSIQQLIESITTKIHQDVNLTEKLNYIVCRTLGNSLEQSITIKFDYNLAKDSLLFYNYQDIGKIEEIYIPNEVTEVKYKSDLSSIQPINLANFIKSGALFNGL